MTNLSVNINKIATLRNARGGSYPNVLDAVTNCQNFGADGITVHPRPDERHVTKKDVFEIKPLITTEFNIEGYPSQDFINMIIEVNPDQVTLVPDGPDVITSCAGWDTIKFQSYLKEIISIFKERNIRTSIFVDPLETMIELIFLKNVLDRIELYTEDYALGIKSTKKKQFLHTKKHVYMATDLGIEINAGHDLSLENLKYFVENIPNLKEVSIGHALISDAIYLGLENTIQMYKRLL